MLDSWVPRILSFPGYLRREASNFHYTIQGGTRRTSMYSLSVIDFVIKITFKDAPLKGLSQEKANPRQKNVGCLKLAVRYRRDDRSLTAL
jgi:hypothetical protein